MSFRIRRDKFTRTKDGTFAQDIRTFKIDLFGEKIYNTFINDTLYVHMYSFFMMEKKGVDLYIITLHDSVHTSDIIEKLYSLSQTHCEIIA